MSTGNSLFPQFPWHRLTKRGTIGRKNSSLDVFSGALGSWKVNYFLLSFSYLFSRSNALSKSGFLVRFLSLSFPPLDFGLSNWSSTVGLCLRNCSTCFIRASGSIACDHAIYTDQIRKKLLPLHLVVFLRVTLTFL